MLKSMTAYGRATVVSPLGRFSVELQSVNRKHLEVNTYLPSELIRYDADIKKWISEAIGRGQVNVRVNMSLEETCAVNVAPNVPLAKKVVDAWRHLGNALSLSLDDAELAKLLCATDGILLYDKDIEDEEKVRSILHEATMKALDKLIGMKVTEGTSLYEDISARVETLTGLIEEMGLKAPGSADRYRVKLQERIQEALGSAIDHEDRLLREVCLFAEKVDIAEEITRFQSHIQQFMKLTSSTTSQGVGKTLEFLIQELNREANTMGSKSADADMIRCVVAIKTELERIREQIQNIE